MPPSGINAFSIWVLEMPLAKNGLRSVRPGNRVLLGATIVAAKWPGSVALLSRLGVDYVEIDAHSIGAGDASSMSQLARAIGLSTIVQVPEAHRSCFGPALDGGAWGVSVPHINSLECAQEVVHATRYAPLGERGTFEPGPQNDFLDDPQDLASINREVHVTVRVDPAMPLATLSKIASLDGIDAIEFEGSTASDIIGPLLPTIQAIKAGGALVSALARKEEEFALLAEVGVQMIRYSSDMELISSFFDAASNRLSRSDLVSEGE